MTILTKVLHLPVQYPLIRGMVSYAVIWPTCSIVQEYVANGTTIENADWARAARFGFFGTFFMAPVFYGWMKYTSRFFKNKTLTTAITRALIEQVSYSPLAMAYFFFGMSALELKPFSTCVNEVKEKFWPTYKIGVVFWPTAQTINFYFVSEKNRIVFVSAASFVWTVYLAHMKAKEQRVEMIPKIVENITDEEMYEYTRQDEET
ncbi:mpv17-like protein 2 [Cydia amplana]|uniref:mpv17-like protein 2 n=1 Tax=Cydia amplana TaxID=1869771 RepID=UPI002FE64543